MWRHGPIRLDWSKLRPQPTFLFDCCFVFLVWAGAKYKLGRSARTRAEMLCPKGRKTLCSLVCLSLWINIDPKASVRHRFLTAIVFNFFFPRFQDATWPSALGQAINVHVLVFSFLKEENSISRVAIFESNPRQRRQSGGQLRKQNRN